LPFLVTKIIKKVLRRKKMKIKIISILAVMMILLGCGMFAAPAATPTLQATKPPLGIGSQKTSDKDGMLIVYVPEGNFQMGTTDEQYPKVLQMCVQTGATQGDCETSLKEEKPAHTVWLDAYWIDRTDVSNAQFQGFVNASNYKSDAEKVGQSYVYDVPSKKWVETAGADWKHPRGPQSSVSGLQNHPVVQISWNDAAAYCQWAGRSLPTEAQWEKAARGTDGRIFPWGNLNPAGNLLNFSDKNLDDSLSDKSIDDGYQLTSPVGNYPDGASPYGALDMAGNVWQWTSGWDGPYNNADQRNPTGPVSGESRVRRGGSWVDDIYNVRSAYRFPASPTNSTPNSGFRCADSAAPSN